MARAFLKYAFVALLALFTTQAVVPMPRVAAAILFVCDAEVEQRVPADSQARHKETPLAAPGYRSCPRPDPDAAVLYQRPPPAGSLFF